MRLNIPERLYKALFALFMVLLCLSVFLIHQYNQAKTEAVEDFMDETGAYCDYIEPFGYRIYTSCGSSQEDLTKWQSRNLNISNTTK